MELYCFLSLRSGGLRQVCRGVALTKSQAALVFTSTTSFHQATHTEGAALKYLPVLQAMVRHWRACAPLFTLPISNQCFWSELRMWADNTGWKSSPWCPMPYWQDQEQRLRLGEGKLPLSRGSWKSESHPTWWVRGRKEGVRHSKRWNITTFLRRSVQEGWVHCSE